MLMMISSTPERPDVRAVRLHDMRRKLLTRSITAVDAQMESIEQGSMVRVIEGPGKVGRCRLKPVFASMDYDVLRLGSLTQCPCVMLCDLTTCYSILKPPGFSASK